MNKKICKEAHHSRSRSSIIPNGQIDHCLLIIRESRLNIKIKNISCLCVRNMPKIEVYCTLDEMKRFLIESTAKNKLPRKYMQGSEILFERRQEQGKIYIEADEKDDIEEIQDLIIVKATNVLGIQYQSKSGRTNLIWRQIHKDLGKLTGLASGNTLVNLLESGIKDIRVIKEKKNYE